MARKTPTASAPSPLRIWTPSNVISMARLAIVVPIVLLLRDPPAHRWAVLAIGVAAYLSDLLDGAVARRWGGESPFGRIIDPLADKIFVAGAAIQLWISGALPTWYFAIVVARDAAIFVTGMYLRARTGVLAQSTLLGKAAVVSVGVALILALFRSSVDEALFTAELLVSLGLLAVSFYSYGERFFSLLRRSRTPR